jgi:uncharacterized repeat protein (TIGR03803 family)
MRPSTWQPLKKFSLSTLLCIVCMFGTATTIASTAQTLTTLVDFHGSNGAGPSVLIQATDGNFYGTTEGGGNNGYGTVFKMTPSGTLTTLYSFCAQPLSCADGADPDGLLQSADDNFYGTTLQGGIRNNGTVFKITPTGALTTLYTFCPQYPCTDGAMPGGLIQATDGNFYGATNVDGVNNGGTLFKITPRGTLTTIYNFCSQHNCTDGAEPNGALVQGSDGNLYGTTYAGGVSVLYGTVFKVTLAGTLTKFYDFCSQPNCTDGGTPNGGLVQAADGNFYGTTHAGGASGDGTVFKISPTGVLTTLYSFCSSTNCFDGAGPTAGLTQATDGNFYGATYRGGAYNFGTLFSMTPSGRLTTLYDFCAQGFDCADGAAPVGLIQAIDGNLYGTTLNGGDPYPDEGTVFRLSVGIVLSPVQFVSVTPCRLVDTRQTHDPIQGGTWQNFIVPQLGGCNIPPTAASYSLNVTVVPQRPLNYLTVWPTGKNQPLVSTMNSLDGRIKANAAIIQAGASGAISVYVTNTANVVLDIDGYFAPVTQSTLAFYPLTPCRVADTRKSNFPQGLGPPHLSAGIPRDFPVLSSTCNIPSAAQAYSFNFTAVPYPAYGDPLGYLELWPTGQMPQNPVSTLNNPTGTYVANAAILPAGTGGEITAYASNDTDVVIDVDGYFAPAGQGGLSLYPSVPCRVVDTRKIGSGQPFSGTLSPPVDVADSACGAPSTAQAYVFNGTVVPSGSLGYLTLWPDSENQPTVSTLNAADGWITSNMAIVPNVNGKIDAYAQGLTQLILDISSYFAP